MVTDQQNVISPVSSAISGSEIVSTTHRMFIMIQHEADKIMFSHSQQVELM